MDHHHHHEPPQPPPPPPPSPCIGATAHLEAGEQGALELVVSMNFTVVEESHGTNEAGPGAVAHAEGHVLLESSPSEYVSHILARMASNHDSPEID